MNWIWQKGKNPRNLFPIAFPFFPFLISSIISPPLPSLVPYQYSPIYFIPLPPLFSLSVSCDFLSFLLLVL
jgi:hypothetical protein